MKCKIKFSNLIPEAFKFWVQFLMNYLTLIAGAISYVVVFILSYAVNYYFIDMTLPVIWLLIASMDLRVIIL